MVNLDEAIGNVHKPVVCGIVMGAQLEELAHLTAVTNPHDDPFVPNAVNGKNFNGPAEQRINHKLPRQSDRQR
jgi:hypothetical protein